MDDEEIERRLSRLLESLSIPYIDVGMGALIAQQDGNPRILTQIRTTYWRPGMKSAVCNGQDAAAEDAYASNIQIAELNALNATLAVIRWKKHIGCTSRAGIERRPIYAPVDAGVGSRRHSAVATGRCGLCSGGQPCIPRLATRISLAVRITGFEETTLSGRLRCALADQHRAEIQILSIHDLLLSKLMSGEVAV